MTQMMSASTDSLGSSRWNASALEDQYVGSLVGVEYAEVFKARTPLLVTDPTVFTKSPFG